MLYRPLYTTSDKVRLCRLNLKPIQSRAKCSERPLACRPLIDDERRKQHVFFSLLLSSSVNTMCQASRTPLRLTAFSRRCVYSHHLNQSCYVTKVYIVYEEGRPVKYVPSPVLLLCTPFLQATLPFCPTYYHKEDTDCSRHVLRFSV